MVNARTHFIFGPQNITGMLGATVLNVLGYQSYNNCITKYNKNKKVGYIMQ